MKLLKLNLPPEFRAFLLKKLHNLFEKEKKQFIFKSTRCFTVRLSVITFLKAFIHEFKSDAF